MLKVLLFIIPFLAGLDASASQSGVSEMAGLDLNRANSLQMQLCSLKPGKKMKDYEDSFDDYIAWSKAEDVETYSLRLTPMFVTQPANSPGFDWIELLVTSFENSGAAWDKWLKTDEGAKLNANWQSIADCRVSVNPVVTMHYENALAMSKDNTRIITMNWCSRLPGVTYDQLEEKHQSMLANRVPGSPISGWSIVYNGLGMRNAPGEYMHMLSFADNAALQAYLNNYSNGEGWRNRVAYETSYATCSGQNVYFAKVLNRPAN